MFYKDISVQQHDFLLKKPISFPLFRPVDLNSLWPFWSYTMVLLAA